MPSEIEGNHEQRELTLFNKEREVQILFSMPGMESCIWMWGVGVTQTEIASEPANSVGGLSRDLRAYFSSSPPSKVTVRTGRDKDLSSAWSPENRSPKKRKQIVTCSLVKFWNVAEPASRLPRCCRK